MIETLLKQPIKPLIDSHPQIGVLLEQQGIGCVPCSVGTCVLGDVVKLHGLQPEVEQQLYRAIVAVVEASGASSPAAA